MSDRDEILEEIRRCAAENGGSPLGRNAFVKATGIRPASIDKHWLRWSEAVAEAGFTPGVMNPAYSDDYVLETLALLVRELQPPFGDLMTCHPPTNPWPLRPRPTALRPGPPTPAHRGAR